MWWFGLVEISNSFTLPELQERSIEPYREIEKGKKERKRIRYVVQKKEKVSLN